MKMKQRPIFIRVGAAVLAVVWVALWVFLATSRGSDNFSATNQPSAETLQLEVPAISDREMANRANLIAVVEVESSEPYLMPPLGGGDVPAGVGVLYTVFTLQISLALKADPAVGDVVILRQLGTEGDDIEDGPVGYLQVGKSYFIVAGYTDDVYFFPLPAGFIEITSPDQESELIATYNDYLSATPVVMWTSTAAASPEPTEIASPHPTEAETLTAVSATGTPEPTHVGTIIPAGTPIDAPSSGSPASE